MAEKENVEGCGGGSGRQTRDKDAENIYTKRKQNAKEEREQRESVGEREEDKMEFKINRHKGEKGR